MTIDLGTGLTIAAILIGIVGSLLGVIWNSLRKSIEESKSIAVSAHAKIDAERAERTNKHDELGQRLGSEVATVKEDVHDLEVTVAGFNGVHATRTELAELRHDMERRHQ